MTLSDELVRRARELDRRAIHALLDQALPVVHRLSLALSGREDVGAGIERFVMGRALHVLPQWRDGDAAVGWFYHHTVLTSRRAQHYPAEAQADVLAGSAADTAYLAFVRSIRGLSAQQREAFLLRHCEGLESRELAKAMDCSIQAAELHLAAGEETLRAMVGERWKEMVNRLNEKYRGIELKEDRAPIVARMIRRHFLPRRIRQMALWALLACAVGAAFYIYR